MQITRDHVEWAVVDRLRHMLEESSHHTFNVTQAYALFTSILCWVTQRIRVPIRDASPTADRAAAGVLEHLSRQRIQNDPWAIVTPSADRIARVGKHSIRVPPPTNFVDHTMDRLVVNLRNAVAHGDARNVTPFNVALGAEQLLAGFTFRCEERDRSNKRKVAWRGEITLLEADLRRLGSHLARRYCDGLCRSGRHREDGDFGENARQFIQEPAA